MGCCATPEDDMKESPIEKERKCTDILFLLLFVFFWVGMVYVGFVAFTDGDPNRIKYSLDSYGNLCGTKNGYLNASGADLSSRKKLYYLDPYEIAKNGADMHVLLFAKRVCVEECPSSQTEICGLDEIPCFDESVYRCPYYRVAEKGLYGKLPAGVGEWDTTYFGELADVDPSVCTGDALGALGNVPDFIKDSFAGAAGSSCGKALRSSSAFPGQGPCYPQFLKTADLLNICIPYGLESSNSPSAPPAAPGSNGEEQLDSSTYEAIQNMAKDLQLAEVERYISDVGKGWVVILVAGLIGGMAVALVWMTILRFFAGCMAWTTVILVNVLFWAATIVLYTKAGTIGEDGVGSDYIDNVPEELTNTADEDRKHFLYSAYAFTGISVLLLLLTLLMYKRIRVAVACIKVASQAISSMPSILLFPIIPFLATLVVFIYWIVVFAYLYSCGELTEVWEAQGGNTTMPTMPCAESPDCYFEYQWNNELRYMMLYHIFGLLWTNQFILGFGYTVVAGAIANFYWARGDSRNMPVFPVLGALKRTCRYHLGTIALGSFIVAIIQFVRLALEYLDRKTKELQEGNVLLKYAMCCVKYCMWYLEKVIKFINRNAYILVASKGTSYCASAQRAVTLIIGNVARLAAVNTVGDILIWLAKLGTALMCGVIAAFLTDLPQYTSQQEYPETYLSSPYLVIAISVILAYFVANIFFHVYEMAVDTVLLSFCEDCERNDGDPKFAPPLLLSAIGKSRDCNRSKVGAEK